MKNIGLGKKIVWIVIALMGISQLTLGVTSCVMAYNSSKNLARDVMLEFAKEATSRTTWELQAYSNIAADMGAMSRLSDESVPAADKQAILDNKTAQYGLQRCNLIDAQGNGIDGNNYSDREYFQAAMQGRALISEPLVSKVTGKLTIIVAAPLWKNGEANSEPVGCVYVVPDEEFLNEIIRDIKVSANSDAYIIDANGNTIAAADIETIKNGENIETLAETDSTYKEAAAIQALARNGETGNKAIGPYTSRMYMSYHPIESDIINDWSLIVYAPVEDFLGGTYKVIYFTAIVFIVALGVSVFVALKMGFGIGKPVRLCAERIERLASGDLTSPIPDVRRSDEIGTLSEATNTVVSKLNFMISDMRRVLEAMADGDLSVDTSEGINYYSGDFEKLHSCLEEINSKLNGTMSRINDSADQVSASAEQVADGAQALSAGATEQASSIEELAATIHTISSQVTLNSENCENARVIVKETANYVASANDEMERLTSAMNDINETSAKISNIIKAIEDIAFQTNILALNAAVEAARAGEAGKGFAVVADEVRNLASKSAEAAKDTTTLIEQSISAVENGTAIAAQTASAMTSVGERTASVEDIVDKIASASEQQADMIEQVTTGVEQISGVVQNNSATAEQSAASAEELSSQATLLKELMNAFALK